MKCSQVKQQHFNRVKTIENRIVWFDFSVIAEARIRSKAMKQEALQAAKEAKKERGKYSVQYLKLILFHFSVDPFKPQTKKAFTCLFQFECWQNKSVWPKNGPKNNGRW